MPIRVLHCYKTYKPDEIGGVAEAISTIVASGDSRLQHAVLVARSCGMGRTFIDGNTPIRAVSSFGVIWSLPIAPGYPFVQARMARSVDLVVHHAPFPLADIGHLISHRKGPAVLVHWHADLQTSKALGAVVEPLVRRTLRCADRIVVPHESIMQSSSFLKNFAAKCIAVPHGIDVASWSMLTDDERKEVVDIRSRFPRLIVSTGRLVGYKGHEVLLRALKEVDATLIIVGKGPLRENLEAASRNLGIDKRVTLAGWLDRSKMKVLLHAARVFAFPSISVAESFGIAQLEAMAAGLPVVNTALPTAVPHIARDGVEGFTVPPGDATGLALALAKLLDDAEVAKKFGHAAQRRVESCFDAKITSRQMGDAYEQAVIGRNT